ncbi:MAG: hypothetical protein IID38_12010 [Planctomycetes bacterium]|nr:hypothetical protein [Planctomycetota bacterium]
MSGSASGDGISRGVLGLLLIAKVTKPDVIPGVTHVDGTARVQTVNPDQNETLCRLLREFDQDETGLSPFIGRRLHCGHTAVAGS